MNGVIRHTGMMGGLVALILLASGCSSTFEPKGPYEQRFIVYSILTNKSDSQFVRVYTTYNPSGHNPGEVTTDTFVPDARVTMSEGATTIAFAPTLVPRDDKSRYASDIGAYVAFPFQLQPGATYALQVAASTGNASASVTVPGEGRVDANNPFVLKGPEKYTEDISAKVRISPVTQGYLLRLFIEFDAQLSQGTVHRRVEVPQKLVPGTGLSYQFEYPRLVRRVVDQQLVYEIVYYSLDAYKALLETLTTQYGEIQLTSATFLLTQVENNLYKYFNLVNGFQDEFSIRTDLPDYSNVQGGYGVFGAMRDDSVVVDLR